MPAAFAPSAVVVAVADAFLVGCVIAAAQIAGGLAESESYLVMELKLEVVVRHSPVLVQMSQPSA